MRAILRSSAVVAYALSCAAYGQVETAPATQPAQAPGIAIQIPGVPMAPTISVPIPGMPVSAAAPAATAPAAAQPGVVAPAQPSTFAVPIPGVPGSPTVSVPVPGQPAAAAAPAGVPPKPGATPPAGAAPAPVAPVAAQPPAPPKPSVAELSFIIDANVNPDPTGRPSPVMVRIYELKSIAAFNRADFFTLYEKDREQLGPDLVNRDEMPLMPGGRPQAITTLRSDTRYLGIVAAFRDIERARWRASTPILVNQTTRMEIKLDRNEVAIRLQ